MSVLVYVCMNACMFVCTYVSCPVGQQTEHQGASMIHATHVQVIKKWYAELPDKLGKVLAQQTASDHQKGDEEMEEEDDEQEEEYLKNEEGWKEEDIEEAVPYDEDPVTVGT